MKLANELTAARHGIPENWLPMLDLSIREVFEIMLHSKLATAPEDQTSAPEFTAMVGLAGELCGVLTLKCSTRAAVQMTSKMLGENSKDTEQHVWDALGEICNMLAGNFKNKLTGMSAGCMLSVPTVVTGADYNLHSLSDSGSIQVSLVFDGEPIAVTLEVHS
jgi:chemotaxis protein CheX